MGEARVKITWTNAVDQAFTTRGSGEQLSVMIVPTVVLIVMRIHGYGKQSKEHVDLTFEEA